MGGTATDYVASAYYWYSAGLVATAARVLALFMDLAPEKDVERVRNDLRDRLRKDGNHLKTGFVGTPYLCRALSEHGANVLAYRLLLNEDYPSWLYTVKMGATTMWERWNSMRPDGTVGGLSMNSFNHYAYGSIVEWMFRHMLGLQPVEDRPGFRKVDLAPQPDPRLKWARGSLDSAAGRYESEWRIGEDGALTFRVRIPFNAGAGPFGRPRRGTSLRRDLASRSRIPTDLRRGRRDAEEDRRRPARDPHG